jgi:uncharacterized repeat protein (TIGR01451 family)
VIAPPTIGKQFGAATVPLNESTSLTFTLGNTNNSTLTGVGFSDTLPAGLVVSSPTGLTGTCGGTMTAAEGASTISLSGGSLPASGSCTVTVNVTGTKAGVQANTTGSVKSTEGGTGLAASASVTVIAPPTVSKTFDAASIPLNGSTMLSFTLKNFNSSTLTGVGFSDTLPAGLVVSTPNWLSGSCGDGTITAAEGGNSISLSEATLQANGTTGSSCMFSVSVTGATAGVQNNTTGQVVSNEGGTGGTASASLTVQ